MAATAPAVASDMVQPELESLSSTREHWVCSIERSLCLSVVVAGECSGRALGARPEGTIGRLAPLAAVQRGLWRHRPPSPPPPALPPIPSQPARLAGASGDLASKKTYPALYFLFSHGCAAAAARLQGRRAACCRRRHAQPSFLPSPPPFPLPPRSFLPRDVAIIGYARSPLTDEQLRERLRPRLGSNTEEVEAFLQRCTYVAGGPEKGGRGNACKKQMCKHVRAGAPCAACCRLQRLDPTLHAGT